MKKLYRITDHPDLVKDMNSKAVLNTNYADFIEHKKKQQIDSDINNLKSEISDIKELLHLLVDKLNK